MAEVLEDLAAWHRHTQEVTEDERLMARQLFLTQKTVTLWTARTGTVEVSNLDEWDAVMGYVARRPSHWN